MTTTRSRRRVTALAAGLAALGVLAAGCGSSADSGSAGGKVTIRYSWWGDATRATMVKKTVALFEKKYPNITIKTDYAVYGDFWEKFNTQAAGGNPPDVFQNSVTFLQEYGQDKHVLLDLTPEVKKGNLDLKGFRNGLEKAGDVDGKLYGVPVGANTFGLVYNPAAFKKIGVTPKPGWTWDEYRAAVKKISDGGAVKGASDTAGVMYLYDLVLRQQGKAFFTRTGLGFTKADLTKWWTQEYAKNKAGQFVAAKKANQVQPKSPLSADLSASEFTWDNFLTTYQALTKTPLAIAPIPTLDGRTTGQYLSSLMLSGAATTKHPDEVAKFITFMTHDPEVGKIMGYNRGILPTASQFDAYQATGVNAQIKAYEQQSAPYIQKMTPQPTGTGVVEAAFLRIYGDIALGKTSVDKGVGQFFDEAAKAFQQ